MKTSSGRNITDKTLKGHNSMELTPKTKRALPSSEPASTPEQPDAVSNGAAHPHPSASSSQDSTIAHGPRPVILKQPVQSNGGQDSDSPGSTMAVTHEDAVQAGSKTNEDVEMDDLDIGKVDDAVTDMNMMDANEPSEAKEPSQEPEEMLIDGKLVMFDKIFELEDDF